MIYTISCYTCIDFNATMKETYFDTLYSVNDLYLNT